MSYLAFALQRVPLLLPWLLFAARRHQHQHHNHNHHQSHQDLHHRSDTQPHYHFCVFSFCVFFVIILTIIALNPAIILTGTSSCQYYRFNMSKSFSEEGVFHHRCRTKAPSLVGKWFISNCQKALWFSSLHSFWQSDTTATQGMAEKNKADQILIWMDWFCSILSIFCRGYTYSLINMQHIYIYN